MDRPYDHQWEAKILLLVNLSNSRQVARHVYIHHHLYIAELAREGKGGRYGYNHQQRPTVFIDEVDLSQREGTRKE